MIMTTTHNPCPRPLGAVVAMSATRGFWSVVGIVQKLGADDGDAVRAQRPVSQGVG
jgi:hypothetical protein